MRLSILNYKQSLVLVSSFLSLVVNVNAADFNRNEGHFNGGEYSQQERQLVISLVGKNMPGDVVEEQVNRHFPGNNQLVRDALTFFELGQPLQELILNLINDNMPMDIVEDQIQVYFPRDRNQWSVALHLFEKFCQSNHDDQLNQADRPANENLNPKRPGDEFTPDEFNNAVLLMQGANDANAGAAGYKERAMKILTGIYSKERAEAIYDAMINNIEDED